MGYLFKYSSFTTRAAVDLGLDGSAKSNGDPAYRRHLSRHEERERENDEGGCVCGCELRVRSEQ